MSNCVRRPKKCRCGCGQPVKPGNFYLHGHNGRGKRYSEEHRGAISAGIGIAWAQGKYPREQSPELVERRIAPLRDRKRPKEVGAKISAAKAGKKQSPEHRAKSSAGWLSGPQNLLPEAEEKRRRAISLQRTGTQGYGRTARDNPQHYRAKYWIIRDPGGRIHEFNNLQSWCRKNEELFRPDDRPESKLPLWRRAVSGFNGIRRGELCSWKGWLLVSMEERKTLGAPDLLGREEEVKT